MNNKTIGKLAITIPFINVLRTPAKVFAEDDIAAKISTGIFGIIDIVRNIANPIAITGVVICGLLMIFGSNQQTIAKVKSWLIAILIGLLMINLAEPTNISNGDLNGAKISITLPTCGIVPVEVVHRTSGGAYIEKFTGSDMHYDPQNETVTVEIDSFSKLEINAFVTPVPVKHHSYTIVNTGVK